MTLNFDLEFAIANILSTYGFERSRNSIKLDTKLL